MPTIFDHIAVATHRIADAPEFIVGQLGGVSGFGGPEGEFQWWHWDFQGGGRIEIIEPYGAAGFVHRFLESRGPGIHHVNLEIPSLRDAIAKAERLGYSVVGVNDSHDYWKEAFLHPKTAMGIVVQIVETGGPEFDHGEWDHPQADPPDEPAERPAAVTVVGLRMRTSDREAAHRLWGALLGAEVTDAEHELIARWPDSPMRIAVTIEDGAPDESVAVEVSANRPLKLPDGPVPGIGTRFVLVGE